MKEQKLIQYQNLINWYDIKDNSRILIVGEFRKEVVEYLKQKTSHISIVQNAANVTEIENDLILLKCTNKIEHTIKELLDALNDEGKILLFADNKIGVNNLTSINKEYKEDDLFENDQLLSKKEIETMLKQLQIENYKFYYALPNYEIPNVIYTDRYLPKVGSSKLNYAPVYNDNRFVFYKENKLLNELVNIDEFTNFVNSYIVEISKNNQINDLKFISFNNMRKSKYSLILKMHENFIEKESTIDEAKEHILNMKENIDKLNNIHINILDRYEENKIISKYIEGQTLEQKIYELLYSGNKEDTINLIDRWYNEFITKLRKTEEVVENKYNSELLKKYDSLNYTLDGFIDLVFENIMLTKNKELIAFDQEWYIECMPIEFIIYRALYNLYERYPHLQKVISQKELLNKYRIQDYVEDFKNVEKNIQNDILDRNIYSNIVYNDFNTFLKEMKRIENENKNLKEDVKWLQEQKNNEIKDKEYLIQVNKELTTKIASIESSKFYKIYKKLINRK